ncbi:MAG: ylbJ1 [Paenibacillus sp.]|nr:ylbJ1 [Paenibacillus sp.]
MRIGMFHARSREYTVALAMLTAILVLFLMLSEMMSGFGAVRGLGTMLEPLMRLLFRLPGHGGWAIAVGAVTGMPAGAEAAGKLRRENLVSREEGERLLALSHYRIAAPGFLARH